MDRKQELLDEQELKDELKEFRNFAFKKNMIELAVAVILGGTFNKVVKGISDYILMPIVNGVTANAEGDWQLWTWEATEGITFEIGKLLGTCLDFLITAIVLYIIYVKIISKVWDNVKDKIDDEEQKQQKKVPIFPK